MKKFVMINLCVLSLMAITATAYSYYFEEKFPYLGVCPDVTVYSREEASKYQLGLVFAPSPWDMNKFFMCWYNPAGEPSSYENGAYIASFVRTLIWEQQCPEGLWFCPEMQICSWPQQPGCTYPGVVW